MMMQWEALAARVRASGCAGWRYAQSGAHPFSDFITVYCDGRVLFERYCRGEAAGLAFVLWADGADAEGALLWHYDACRNSRKTEAPRRLTPGGEQSLPEPQSAPASQEALFLDDRRDAWTLCEKRRRDAAHGYSAFKLLCLRLRHGGAAQNAEKNTAQT